MDAFWCGMYKVEWYNKQGKVVKSEIKYMNWFDYRREEMAMQTAYLQGKDVASMKAMPMGN